jgi:RimJ/RimL family protein N-acetyltransferase
VFGTGSWVARAQQGRGIGTEMRQAVLHLGFAGLGALAAETAAFHDNAASLGVTAHLGYEPNGETVELRRGTADRMLRFRMPRERWEANRRRDIRIAGLAPCLPLLVGPA